jgi:hypothetical protein
VPFRKLTKWDFDKLAIEGKKNFPFYLHLMYERVFFTTAYISWVTEVEMEKLIQELRDKTDSTRKDGKVERNM